jgi:acyl transferase domain-containing protein/acyl carrier protein
MTADQPAPIQHEPLAIVGIGCHFPGGAVTPDAFWHLLSNGVDATRDLPANRWEARKFYDPDPGKLGKMSTCHGGYLDSVDGFDAAFFGISPREAVWLDPQQRLLMRTTWEAFEDAGQDVTQLAGRNVGVFVGGFTLDYKLLQNYGVYSRYELQTHSAIGMMMSMLANRLSYTFDFRGPSFTVDTACSGSLVALHLAAQALWNNECEQAVVGGVNIMVAPNMTIAESKGGFLSPDGRCKTFDASANGYARGEGAGVVVLKPLAQAQEDGDDIYALIRGTAVTQDGHTNGITVPNGDAQEEAMRLAYARAGITPLDIQYVEAHGTGTPLGDPIEANAISRVVSQDRPAGEKVIVGSVKTNIGHLEAAAGIAGLIKVALSLKNGHIPENLHFNNPNPAIPFDRNGLRVPTELTAWPDSDGPRLAGINSFGFGGTNAHAVLQGPPPRPDQPPASDDGRRQLITISARSPKALRDMAEAMAGFFTTTTEPLSRLAHATNLRRTKHEYRLAVTAADPHQISAQLRDYLTNDHAQGVVTGRAAASTERPKLAFVFSGMGPQWWGMGRQLLTTEPVFREAVEEVDAHLHHYTGWSILEEMLKPEDESRMSETEIAQPANFALQVGLLALWRSWGIDPDAIIGHSAGEAAAQYAAGVLTLADAVRVIYYRSTLQQRTTGSGRMLAVGMTPETLDKAVADAGPSVSVAAINSPSAVTLSGDGEILESMASQLETFGVFHRFLQVKVPYHSHYMDPLREELQAGLAQLSPVSARIPLYSTVIGGRIDGAGADGRYWWQNVRATVLFSAAFAQMIDDGYTHFVEVSPHPVLAGPMRELLSQASADSLVVPSLRRGDDEEEAILTSLGTLYCHGHHVTWDSVRPHHRSLVKLPTYPWQLERYWHESAEAAEDRYYQESHPLLGQRMKSTHPAWELEVDPHQLPYLADHRIQDHILMPGAAFIEMALAAATEVYGAGDYAVEDLQLLRALVLSPTSNPRMRTTVYQDQGLVEIASYLALPDGERNWTIHATATLAKSTVKPSPIDSQPATPESSQSISREEFYSNTLEMGFQYGPAFQAVQDVTRSGRAAAGRIAIPASIAEDVQAYHFHPSLIDAAFQVLLIVAATSGEGEQSTATMLPVHAERIRVLAPPTPEMTVVAEVIHADETRILSDITVCDLSGTVLVEIRGFKAQSLTTAQKSLDRIDRGLYELLWQPHDLDDVEDTPPVVDPEPAPWLVFSDAGGVGETLATLLDRSGRPAIRVLPADITHPEVREDGTHLIDPANPDHYAELIATLNHRKLHNVVHLWSLDLQAHEENTAQDLLDAQDRGALSVLHLVQALANELAQAPRIWLVTSGVQAIDETGDTPNIAQAPLWGLGRVLGHQEFPAMWGGLYDLDPRENAAHQAKQLLHEIDAATGEDQVAFRNGHRYQARLANSPHLQAPFPVRVRRTGSYLITGGLGSLGLLVARFLAERGARHVVLMGRSTLPPRHDWPHLDTDHPQHDAIHHILAIETLGTQIHVAAVDASNMEDLTSWLASHQESGLPEFAGVIHAAGVVDDDLIQRMDRVKFLRALTPKVAAGWNLHRLFRDDDLDFFVLFSSTGSVLASPGQANYASGNAFLDALAHQRHTQGLPALSIGWGPWSVGMVKQLDLAQVYARRGIELITPEAGMQTLARILQQRPAHLVAITADWQMVRDASPTGQLPPMFNDLDGVRQNDSGELDLDSPLARIRQATPSDRADILSDWLQSVVGKVLGMDAEQVNPQVALSSLGLDSMMAIEIKTRIEVILQTSLSVLDLLQGATITSLAETLASRPEMGEVSPDEATPSAATPDLDDELVALLEGLPEDELAAVLADLGVSTDVVSAD